MITGRACLYFRQQRMKNHNKRLNLVSCRRIQLCTAERETRPSKVVMRCGRHTAWFNSLIENKVKQVASFHGNRSKTIDLWTMNHFYRFRELNNRLHKASGILWRWDRWKFRSLILHGVITHTSCHTSRVVNLSNKFTFKVENWLCWPISVWWRFHSCVRLITYSIYWSLYLNQTGPSQASTTTFWTLHAPTQWRKLVQCWCKFFPTARRLTLFHQESRISWIWRELLSIAKVVSLTCSKERTYTTCVVREPRVSQENQVVDLIKQPKYLVEEPFMDGKTLQHLLTIKTIIFLIQWHQGMKTSKFIQKRMI